MQWVTCCLVLFKLSPYGNFLHFMIVAISLWLCLILLSSFQFTKLSSIVLVSTMCQILGLILENILTFTYYFLRSKIFSKCFTNINTLSLFTTSMIWVLLLFPFLYEETQAQGGEVTCLGHIAKKW